MRTYENAETNSNSSRNVFSKSRLTTPIMFLLKLTLDKVSSSVNPMKPLLLQILCLMRACRHDQDIFEAGVVVWEFEEVLEYISH